MTETLAHRHLGHAVSFFRDDGEVVEAVCDYIAVGLELGEPCLAAVEPQRMAPILDELENRGLGGVGERLTFISATVAAETLAGAGGPLDVAGFERMVLPLLHGAAERSRTGKARVYGEIVNVLWRQGKEREAAELEDVWTRLAKQVPFRLYCGYVVDLLNCRCDVWNLVNAHDAVLSSGQMADAAGGVERALGEILGPRGVMVRALVDADPRLASLPYGEAALIWLGRHMPLVAKRVVSRAGR